MRWGAIGGAALLVLAACQQHIVSPSVPREVTIYVAIGDGVVESNDGNVAAMIDVLEAELRSEGRAVTVEVARLGEAPPVPRLELQVLGSNPGNPAARGAEYAVGVAGGVAVLGDFGHAKVDAFVVPSGGRQPIFLGRFSASSFGALTEESVAAGERVGQAIASSLRNLR
jgi:hypothetical protein